MASTEAKAVQVQASRLTRGRGRWLRRAVTAGLSIVLLGVFATPKDRLELHQVLGVLAGLSVALHLGLSAKVMGAWLRGRGLRGRGLALAIVDSLLILALLGAVLSGVGDATWWGGARGHGAAHGVSTHVLPLLVLVHAGLHWPRRRRGRDSKADIAIRGA